MALKFREILFTIFCAASAVMLLIFIPLAILLSPSAGYASLGYHPHLAKLLLYGLFIPTVLATAGYGLVKLLLKQNKKRLQSRQQGHRPTDEQIALYNNPQAASDGERRYGQSHAVSHPTVYRDHIKPVYEGCSPYLII